MTWGEGNRRGLHTGLSIIGNTQFAGIEAFGDHIGLLFAGYLGSSPP